MLSRLILLCSLMLAHHPACAMADWKEIAAPLHSFYAGVSSPFLEVLSPESSFYNEDLGPVPFIDKILAQDFLRYNPDVSAEPLGPDCGLGYLQEKILNGGSFAQISNVIADYMQRCEKQVKRPWLTRVTSLNGLYGTVMIRYWPQQSPYGREVMLHLPGDLRVKGYLAMKGDGRARPLIIFRLGVFSRASTFPAELFELMQLFEDSPFNFLVLESTTGPDFIRRNSVVNFAGFDEGVEDYQIAEAVQNPREPISKFVSGAHMVGMSMGGHGMFMAALLDEWGQREHRPAKFQSFIGLCPLVDFRGTWESHRNNWLVSPIANKRIDDKLHNVPEKIPKFPIATLLQDLVPYLSSDYAGSKSMTADLPLPPEVRRHLKDFWWLNDFWPRFRDIGTPILIFATTQDPLVPFALNSARFLDQSLDLGTTPIKVIPLSESIHCSLPGAYQWKMLTILQQSYLLSQSKNFSVRKHSRELRLNWGGAGPDVKSPLIRVVESENPGQIRWQLISAEDQRFLGQLDVPFLETGFAPVPIKMVQKSLERWAQVNLRWTWLKTGDSAGVNARVDWFE